MFLVKQLVIKMYPCNQQQCARSFQGIEIMSLMGPGPCSVRTLVLRKEGWHRTRGQPRGNVSHFKNSDPLKHHLLVVTAISEPLGGDHSGLSLTHTCHQPSVDFGDRNLSHN